MLRLLLKTTLKSLYTKVQLVSKSFTPTDFHQGTGMYSACYQQISASFNPHLRHFLQWELTEIHNWTICRERNCVGHAVLNGMSSLKHSHKAQGSMWKRQKNGRSQRWRHSKNSVLTGSRTDVHMHVWLSQHKQGLVERVLALTGRSRHWLLPLTKKPRSSLQLIPVGTGHINHTPGQDPGPGGAGQHKKEAQWYFCEFFSFLLLCLGFSFLSYWSFACFDFHFGEF